MTETLFEDVIFRVPSRCDSPTFILHSALLPVRSLFRSEF